MTDGRRQMFGASVRVYRERAKWTQPELGARVGITGSAIANIEAGRNFPEMETALNLAALFHTTIDAMCTPNQDIFKASHLHADQITVHFVIVIDSKDEATKEAFYELLRRHQEAQTRQKAEAPPDLSRADLPPLAGLGA